MGKSLWIESKKAKKYESLQQDIEVEVCIIGGGLTGITTAYYLSKEGKKVAVLEKNYIGSHTTGNTTGKITSQHGLFYSYLINSIGENKAKKYLEANEEAIKNIEKIVTEEKIDCDFEKQNSYVFTQLEEEVKKIKDEVKALNTLGFNAEFVNKIDIPVKVKEAQEEIEKINSNENININKPILGAIKFTNQAQFNSYKYLLGLAKKVEENGGIIYENSMAIEVKKCDEKYLIKTEKANVKAKYVVIASHYPIVNFPGFYFMKMYQETSYLIAIETKQKLFDGMYISSENPSISLRTAIYEGKRVVIIGGMQHKTGAKIDLSNSYKNLEKIAKDLYPDSKVLFKWSSQDCISLDKIPYIGEFSSFMPNVFVGTGYKKWGMTTSNVAANIIADKILGKENNYEEVFDSKRLQPIKNYKELTNMVKEVSYSLGINKLKKEEECVKNIKRGEGKIIKIEGEKVGVYKDENNNIYAIKPYCSHLGCELSWNNLEKIWDCPCHGSKFNYDGKNIYDPAIKNLEKINIEN